MRRLWLAPSFPTVCVAVVAAMGAAVSMASSTYAGEHEDAQAYVYKHEDVLVDQDLARQALMRGEIQPLEKVLAAARPEIDGEFVGAELEVEYGVWVYDIKFIDRSGMMRNIHVDAKTAELISRDVLK